MSKALELIQMAKEGNASRFGDILVAGIQERVVAAVAERRSTLFAAANVNEGKNPFAKEDDEDEGDKDEEDKGDKSEKSDKDEDDTDDKKGKDKDEDA